MKMHFTAFLRWTAVKSTQMFKLECSTQLSRSVLITSCIHNRSLSSKQLHTVRSHLPFKTLQLSGCMSNTRSLKTPVSKVKSIQENVSALHLKKRPIRRKRLLLEEEDGSKAGLFNVAAYATAEEYNLEQLMQGLLQEDLYQPSLMCNGNETDQTALPDVVHAKAKYRVGTEPREIFFFREGTLVLWNVSELEISNILGFLRNYEEKGFDERIVQGESEMMVYSRANAGQNSHLQGENMVLADNDLDKYTFSNALALSVKLGIWEASLNRYIDSIEYVTEDLKQGRKIRISQEEVLRKTGELFALRHLINLSSDLLDTPDFYWDHEQQEALYQQMCAYLSIARRTRVMNEKLNHCVELVELLSSHLSDRHHVRLEWMIIALIMIEVCFEMIHYADRFLAQMVETVLTAALTAVKAFEHDTCETHSTNNAPVISEE